MPEEKFIHLHVHSHYSLLNALPTSKELVQRAQECNMSSLALTDNGSLYGAINFYKACKAEGIKPIIGIDAYLAPRTRHDKDGAKDKPRARLVLIAQNELGYKNLIKMVSASYTEGFYYRPRIDQELLEKYGEGLVCIIPSFAGETSHALKNESLETAHERASWYKNLFPHCYLEITHHPEMPGHMELNEKIKNLGKETSIPLVAAHDVYYLEPEDRLAREAMIKIQTGGTIEEATAEFEERDEDFSFITQEQAVEYFKDTPEALENTLAIRDLSNLEIELGVWYFPNYVIESGKEPNEELRSQVLEGLAWRELSFDDPIIKERIEYELEIITIKEYAKYFLVVGDLLNEARKRGILTTIRGSVAGSLVTYALGITNVDPLAYKLPFERFLNPERPSAPDIDMDFADNRRDEIIDYAREKYGEKNVAQIGTFGTMMARAAVRDVARALGHPYAIGDQIAKLIPMGSQGFPMTIDRALEIEPDLNERYKKDPDTTTIIDLAKKIEGKARHISVHAAGVVIAPTDLTDFTPIQFDPKGGKLITQYEMHSVGEDGVGLLKFDFLGITNLSILADSVDRVRAIHGQEIDIEHIPLDDANTFEMLARGETMGVFQMGGSGMTHFLKELKPTSIHDINAMVALYRPGPMESIPKYIERKHNPRLIQYLDPRLEKILDLSYGVITYQDDVLMISRELAGYSWLEADMLRKAMGKKIPKVMEAEKEKLIAGFIEHGKLPREKGERLWKLIEPFAAYGFNKAHAASYGKVAYQTAYMKANYPLEYMSAVLTADSGNIDKVSEGIRECERMGIPVLPPDINESFADFSVVPAKNSIRFGLTSIKNFGSGIAETIITERKAHGHFSSLSDFLTRVQSRNLNKKSLEALILAGALDRFAERGAMLHNTDTFLEYNKERGNERDTPQDSLFAGTEDASVHEVALEDTSPMSNADKLSHEKELLGIYVSGHPLEGLEEELKKYQSIKAVCDDGREGIPVKTAGLVEEVKEIMTKKGDHMAFVRLGDIESSIEIVFFPKLLREKRDVVTSQAKIAVKGRLSYRNGEASIVAEAVKAL